MSLSYLFSSYLAPLRASAVWPGLRELGRFIGSHLISGMIPAFFIAGAISIFVERQRISRLLGENSNPFLAYPFSALMGVALTFCSCGVIPIFAVLVGQGAGIGPSFTFLLTGPAVNVVSMFYTYSLAGWRFTLGRFLFVVISGILVGLGMKAIFGENPPGSVDAGAWPGKGEVPPVKVEGPPVEGGIKPFPQTALVMMLLFLIMITATGWFDWILMPEGFAAGSAYLSSNGIRGVDFLMAKMMVILTEVIMLAIVLWMWFPWYRTVLWLWKSVDLIVIILPKILVGVFISGMFATLLPLSNPHLLATFDNNSLIGNFLAAFIGSLMYFGSIVGINIVATLINFGMHPGPAMALTLAGPAIGLPGLLAIVPVVRAGKVLVFSLLVVAATAFSGLLYGAIF